ncbi:MAG TPA: hypothetical protein EYP85_12515 [Armatimonadetes bacterium]|nr:hypothetical protein [Armatimonadota bacterium]
MLNRGETLLEPLRAEFKWLLKLVAPPLILTAQLGLNAGLIGALTLAQVGHRR